MRRRCEGSQQPLSRGVAAALLASLAGAALAVPATAAEVQYDPHDTVYFTYCHAHPPAARIKPGDTVVTREGCFERRVLPVGQDGRREAGSHQGQSADRPVLCGGRRARATHWWSISTASISIATSAGAPQFQVSGSRTEYRPPWSPRPRRIGCSWGISTRTARSARSTCPTARSGR